MPDPAKDIRAAIEQGEYARAGALWEEWTSGEMSGEEWARVQELYLWSRNVMLAEKAHLLYQQNNLHVASVYLNQNRF